MFDDLVKRKGLYFLRFSSVPFTGEVIGHGQGSIKEGKRDGIWEKYYPNGKLLWSKTYKSGELEGAWLTYYITGQLRWEQHYKNGQLDGVWSKYLPSGELVSEEIFKDGALQDR